MGFVLAASTFPPRKLFFSFSLVLVIVGSLASDCVLCFRVTITALEFQIFIFIFYWNIWIHSFICDDLEMDFCLFICLCWL